MFNLTLAPLFKVPTFQTPVFLLYLPFESSLIQIKDLGRTSLTLTPVAMSGPLLVTVIVHLTISFIFTTEALTDFTIHKSAAGATSILDWS